MADNLGRKTVTGISVRSEHRHTATYPLPPAMATGIAKLTVPSFRRAPRSRDGAAPAGRQTAPAPDRARQGMRSINRSSS
jgi:hypothetical protein